jgi:hypothetical protein
LPRLPALPRWLRDFENRVKAAMGNSAAAFGQSLGVTTGSYLGSNGAFFARYANGTVGMVRGVNMINMLDDLQERDKTTCTSKDTRDASGGKVTLVETSYACTTPEAGDSYLGFVGLSEEGRGFLFYILGTKVPAASAKPVADRLFEGLKSEYR